MKISATFCEVPCSSKPSAPPSAVTAAAATRQQRRGSCDAAAATRPRGAGPSSSAHCGPFSLRREVAHTWQKHALAEAGERGGLAHVRCFNHAVGFPGWPNCDGTGLMILSRWPITETAAQRFRVNGRPYRVPIFSFERRTLLGT